jgi:hypothetical protein
VYLCGVRLHCSAVVLPHVLLQGLDWELDNINCLFGSPQSANPVSRWGRGKGVGREVTACVTACVKILVLAHCNGRVSCLSLQAG